MSTSCAEHRGANRVDPTAAEHGGHRRNRSIAHLLLVFRNHQFVEPDSYSARLVCDVLIGILQHWQVVPVKGRCWRGRGCHPLE